MGEENAPVIRRIKHWIREELTSQYDGQYLAELEEQTTSYHPWITSKEEAAEDVSRRIPMEESGVLAEDVFSRISDEDVMILAEDISRVTKKAMQRICEIFETMPEVCVIYTDEEEVNSNEKVRMNPWFKPDYSPDTLLSYFYFGSLVAVRRSLWEQEAEHKQQLENLIPGKSEEARYNKRWKGSLISMKPVEQGVEEEVYRKEIYERLLRICFSLSGEQIYHCKEMLYASHNIRYWGYEEAYREMREKCDRLRLREELDGVSIIIPSKDQPEVLKRALESIRHWTKHIPYELIVVDNGSREENREKIEQLQQNYGFEYLYQPMEFNFSRMCNLGAERAKHSLLLFLNDDCEVRGSKWLSHMAALALVKTTGAVGAKLYYPNSKKIQHCGIYNIHVGPVHKLQFKEDIRPYYDRRNVGTRNVLAVTAACLMVRNSVFRQVGGFDETFAVAFNDVDFCYRLHEAGYYNVTDNEIHLWHHESLSRGSDDSKDKLERLMREKRKLYERHPKLWEHDPYYHEGFSTDILDTGFSFDYEYPRHRPLALENPASVKRLPDGTKTEQCVVSSIEYAGDLEGWFLEKEGARRLKERLGCEQAAYLQGSAVVLGSDNAIYTKRLLLRHEETGALYQIEPEWYYRPDVEANLQEQRNVALSGFACFVELDGLPKGEYELGILVRDNISKSHYLGITTRRIERK